MLERPSNAGLVRRAKKARLSPCCACLPDASFAEPTRTPAAAPVTAEDVWRGEWEIDAVFREALKVGRTLELEGSVLWK